MMNVEAFPIVEGLVVGLVLGWVKPRARLRIGAPLAMGLGAVATIASGEFRTSWGFLLVDVSLAGGLTLLAALASHRWGRAREDAEDRAHGLA